MHIWHFDGIYCERFFILLTWKCAQQKKYKTLATTNKKIKKNILVFLLNTHLILHITYLSKITIILHYSKKRQALVGVPRDILKRGL